MRPRLISAICVLAIFVSSPGFCAEAPSSAPSKGLSQLSPADQQIEHDLEDLLVTQGEIKTEIQAENLSLLEAAIKYNKSAAFTTLLESTIVAYFLLREPVRLGTLYAVNISRFVRAIRLGEQLRSIEFMEKEAVTGTVTAASFGLSVASSLFYMSTTLYQKGVCIFNCLENFVSRVSDDQQAEFLNSPTFANIEKEIGHVRAIQFVSLMGTLRAENYSNEKTMRSMIRFVDKINGKAVRSVNDLNIPSAPTFSRAVQIINGVYNLNELVTGYLYDSGQRT